MKIFQNLAETGFDSSIAVARMESHLDKTINKIFNTFDQIRIDSEFKNDEIQFGLEQKFYANLLKKSCTRSKKIEFLLPDLSKISDRYLVIERWSGYLRLNDANHTNTFLLQYSHTIGNEKPEIKSTIHHFFPRDLIRESFQENQEIAPYMATLRAVEEVSAELELEAKTRKKEFKESAYKVKDYIAGTNLHKSL